ncbi:MAG: TRAP transporter permease DctQ [Cytophagaceae bacterium]|nr:TRAP transporter permease DctQ [Cytophagaceae bacterium]|tara:strand:- start:1066 stop:1539 length:474 start_codon:yes stop_codon:yes gene_type:complete
MKLKNILDKALGSLLILLMATMLLSVLWQIFTRYVLNSPSSVTEELSRFTFIWMGILGAAYASGQKIHVTIDLLSPKLNDKQKGILQVAISILIMLFCLLALVIGGGNLVYVNHLLGQHSAALNLPLSTVYSVLPLGGVIIIIYKLIELFKPKTAHS